MNQPLNTALSRPGEGLWQEGWEDDMLLGGLFQQAVSEFGQRPGGDFDPRHLAEVSGQMSRAEADAGDVVVDLTDDGMEAWLTVMPSAAGPVTHEAVQAAMAEAGVVHGILCEGVEHAVSATRSVRLRVARGTPAHDGQDARFEVVAQFPDSGKPAVREDGTVDYHNLSAFPSVKAGDPLLRRHAATEGVAGLTVTGKVLPAHRGQDRAFLGDCMGAAVSPADPDLLVATQGGTPKLLPNGAHVLPLLTLEQVDLSTGNIQFNGSVMIKGAVAAGFKVHAAGDIHVMGVVEAADLFAKGDIRIDKGVVGQGKAKIKAYGDVSAYFIESAALVEAGGSIQVDELVLHTRMVAFDRVVVKGVEGKGQIIGGVTQAAVRVDARSLGGVSNPLTKVEVGTMDFESLLAGVRMRLNVRKQNLARMAPESEACQQLRWDVMVLGNLEKSLLDRRSRVRMARIVVQDMVYRGVALQIQDVKRHIQEDALGATFRISPDRTELLAGATLY